MNEVSPHERIKLLITRFVLGNNYWGYLFSQVRRKPMETLPSIMGVAPENDGTITLYYNPTFMNETDDENLLKVIEHEGMHLLNKHIPRLIRILEMEVSEEAKLQKSKIWNIAADCCVNSQAKLPDTLKIAGNTWSLCHPKFYKLPDGKLTEWYYNELMKNQENEDKSKKQKKGQGKGRGDSEATIGDHTKWKDNLQGVSDLSSLSRKIDQHIRNIIKESTKTFNKERGRFPSHIADLIRGALEPPKAPYYQIIKKLVRGTRRSKFIRSPTRINRKRTYAFHLEEGSTLPSISPFPGKIRDFTFDIVILIDTSGSMSNDDIKEGLSGCKNVIEKDKYCHTTVLEVDAGVEKEYEVKKVRDIQFNIKGRGGTVLGPGLIRARELECDVCLVFTDGYTENINMMNRKLLPKRIIWVITKDGTDKNVNRTGWVVRLPT